MADEHAKKMATIAEVVDKLKAAQARCFELREQLEALLSTEQVPAIQIKSLFSAWARVWAERYRGERYLYPMKKDRLAAVAQFKALLKVMTPDEIERRMKQFIVKSEPFYCNSRHNLTVFVKTINQHGQGQPAGMKPTTEWLCPHDPHCPAWAVCLAKSRSEGEEQAF